MNYDEERLLSIADALSSAHDLRHARQAIKRAAELGMDVDKILSAFAARARYPHGERVLDDSDVALLEQFDAVVAEFDEQG